MVSKQKTPPEIFEIAKFIDKESIIHLTIECGDPRCVICSSIVDTIRVMGVKINNFMSPLWPKWIEEAWD